MFNRLIFFIFLFLSLISCDFNKKSEISGTNQETESIDFSSVDAYPLLNDCKQITSRALQKQCFYKLLSKQIEKSINPLKMNLSHLLKDTILVKIQISSKGKIKVKSFNLENNSEFKDFKNAIIYSIDNLSIIQPAIKHGVPVTTEFVLPIVIK